MKVTVKISETQCQSRLITDGNDGDTDRYSQKKTNGGCMKRQFQIRGLSFFLGTLLLLPSVHFGAAESGTISGTVYQADGVTPVTGVSIAIEIYPADSDPCAESLDITSVNTNPEDGTYKVTGLEPGRYRLFTNTGENSGYRDEWWASSSSSPDCSAAETIVIESGSKKSGKDFQLDVEKKSKREKRFRKAK
jgi:hypothetical protein